MFGFPRRPSGRDLVEAMHGRIVAASRAPALYGEGGLPDTVEGRFESLVLHVVIVLRRLRALPPPAFDAAQDLVDAVFAHLEIALREMGVGDFGVPKRMKKLARAFYDRSAAYDRVLDDREALVREMAERLDLETLPPRIADYMRRCEAMIGEADLPALLAGPHFAEPAWAVEVEA